MHLSRRTLQLLKIALYLATLFTTGGFHVPFEIEEALPFGQYARNMSVNSPFGAGSQLACRSPPSPDNPCPTPRPYCARAKWLTRYLRHGLDTATS